eukprot:Em0014g125a
MDRRCKDLRDLAVQKEQELQTLREHHANHLEEALKDAHTEIVAERRRFRDLRNDFEYNLSLLEQRDAELSRYDTAFAELRQTVQNLVAENSELKIEVDRLGQVVSTHKEKEEQLKTYYLQRIEEHRHQLDAYRQVKDREVAGDRAECARLQKELQAKLVNVQGELGVDRERMEAQDGQLRELGKELQAAKTAAECARREAEEKREEAGRVERGSLDKERGLLDRLNAQELKVVDSETRLASAEARLKALQGEAARKLADADRDLREKERALVATREACHNLERDMEQLSDTFRGQLEVAVETSRKEQEVHRAALEDKRLEAESRDADVEKCVKALFKQIIFYLKPLLQVLSRSCCWEPRGKHSLQQEKAQGDLDWARKLEEAEREAYSRHEAVITQLSKSRDKAIAECKQLQAEATKQAETLKCLQAEGAVIQEMRREMEQCVSADPAGLPMAQLRVKDALSRVSDAPYSAEYVCYLERELAEMKAEKRKMAERLDELAAHRKPPNSPSSSPSPSPKPCQDIICGLQAPRSFDSA